MELNYRQWPMLCIGLLFFAINFSGDHVFFKTNTLNLTLLALSCSMLVTLLCAQLKSEQGHAVFGLAMLFITFAILPVLATLPGLILNGGNYNYFSAHEYSVHLLTIIWAGLLYFSIRNDQSVTLFLNMVAAVVVYFLVIGILQKFGVTPLLRFGINYFDATWAGWQIPYSGHVQRVTATTGNPNYLAGMVIQLVPVFASLAIIARSKQALRYTLVALALLFLGIESGSRGALLALIISLAFFFLSACYYRLISIRPLHIAAFATVVGFALTYIALSASWIDRIILIGTDSSSITRLHIWQAAINSIMQAPLLGFGTGSSYALFFSFSDPDIRLFSGRSFVHPHNDWLEVLQEGGLLGLGTYLAFWTGIFVYALRFIKTPKMPKRTRLFALGILAGLLAIHVHGMVSVAPRMVAVRLVTYSLVALLFYLICQPIRQNRPSQFIASVAKYKWQVFIVLSIVTMTTTAYVLYYSYGQWQHASVISNSHEQPNILLSTENQSIYSDVFLLDRAIDAAQAEHEHNMAIAYSIELHEQIPFYRDVMHEHAVSLFKLQYYEQAYNVAKEAYKRDRYLLENLELLLLLSQQQQDTIGFQTYFIDLLKFHICKNKSLPCLPVKSDPQPAGHILRRSESGTHYMVNINAFVTSNDIGDGFKLDNASNLVWILSNSSLLNREALQANSIVMQELISTMESIDELTKHRKNLAVYSGLGFWVDRERYLIQTDRLNSLISSNEDKLATLQGSLPNNFELNNYLNLRQFVIDFVKSCVATK